MGQYASALSDEVILTSDDCYGEDVNRIIAQIKSGIATNHGHIHSLPDRFQALAFALKLATSGDVIAVLGQGHEQTLNLDGHKEISWSDQAIIKSQLSGSTQNPLRQYFPHHKV
jgi:UDP-N-acetylmuramoyl-L-alanyl-D-glutamate--2,6-diaminopimelate ligase